MLRRAASKMQSSAIDCEHALWPRARDLFAPKQSRHSVTCAECRDCSGSHADCVRADGGRRTVARRRAIRGLNHLSHVRPSYSQNEPPLRPGGHTQLICSESSTRPSCASSSAHAVEREVAAQRPATLKKHPHSPQTKRTGRIRAASSCICDRILPDRQRVHARRHRPCPRDLIHSALESRSLEHHVHWDFPFVFLPTPPPICGEFQIFHDQDTKTHTPRARAGLSVALSALSRATRSWPTCAPSVRSRARPTGSHGTMQHGCRAVAVSDALPMVTRTMLVCTTCVSHTLT